MQTVQGACMRLVVCTACRCSLRMQDTVRMEADLGTSDGQASGWLEAGQLSISCPEFVLLQQLRLTWRQKTYHMHRS